MTVTVAHNLNSGNVMLKSRVWISGLVSFYLVLLAFYTLSIDFSVMKEPTLRPYHCLKWKLITSWVNMIMLVYFPVSCYCDWRELRGQANRRHVGIINSIRHSCFTNVLFPATMFADIVFWRIWLKDSELLAPKELEAYLPMWTNHCLHTVSLLVLVLDLIFVPRRKPDCLKPGLLILTIFVWTYNAVVLLSILQGYYVYPMLRNFSIFKIFLLSLFMYTESIFYFTVQWLAIDFLWGKKMNIRKEKAL